MLRRLLAALAIALACPGISVAAAPADGSTSLSAALARVGEDAETIYDAVKAADWSTARRRVASVRRPAAAIVRQWTSKSEATALESALAALEAAVTARRRDVALREANRMTLITAEMARVFSPPVPLAVTRLDYLGRELEIWSQPNDPSRLEATAADIHATWQELRPALDATRDARIVGELDGLVARLRAAQPPYRALAGELLDAVDRLEAVFKKKGRP
jgi:hypothetical protein